MMYTTDGYWWIRADFHTHITHEHWIVHVMCIDKTKAPPEGDGLDAMGGWLYREYEINRQTSSVETPIPRFNLGYECGIVGLTTTADGDIDEDGGGLLFEAFTEWTPDAYLKVITDFRSEGTHESWIVKVLCWDQLQNIFQEGDMFFYSHTYYIPSDNGILDIGISTSSYACGIVGMRALWGDMIVDRATDILIINMFKGPKSTWNIKADIGSTGEHEWWTIDVLCVSKQIARDARTDWIK